MSVRKCDFVLYGAKFNYDIIDVIRQTLPDVEIEKYQDRGWYPAEHNGISIIDSSYYNKSIFIGKVLARDLGEYGMNVVDCTPPVSADEMTKLIESIFPVKAPIIKLLAFSHFH